MKLSEVKDYTLGVLRGSFMNKNILDNISAEGKSLLYKGKNLGDSYIFEGIENYSEEEIVVGRWIDGKPLYKKTITNIKSGSSDSIVAIWTGPEEMNIVHLEGSYGGWPINNMSGGNWWISTGFNKNVISNGVGVSQWMNMPGTITVYYTKTTDAEGSADDLIAAPANFIDGATYSEDEQIVGQWIDGKPVYRKTISFTVAYGENYADLNIDNADLVWAVGGFLKTHDLYEGLTWPMMYLHHSSTYHDRYAFSLSWVSATQLSYFCGSDSNFVNSTGYITLEYTKTTDSPQDMLVTPTLTTLATDAEVEEVFS